MTKVKTKKYFFFFTCENKELLVPDASVRGSVGKEKLAGLLPLMGSCCINPKSALHPKNSFSLAIGVMDRERCWGGKGKYSTQP